MEICIEMRSSVDLSPAILLTQCLYLLPECLCFLGWCKSQSPGSQPVWEGAYVLYLKVMKWVSRQSYNLRVDSVQWLLDKDLQTVSLYSTSNNFVLTCSLKGEFRKLLKGALRCFRCFYLNASDVFIQTLRMPYMESMSENDYMKIVSQ